MDDETRGLSSGLDGRRRRARRTDEAAHREAMFASAQALIAEAGGLTVSLQHLSYEEVIAGAGIPRSAAYRIWPYKDDFYVDLLAELAGPRWQGTASFDAGTRQTVVDVITSDPSALADPDRRAALLDEAVRQAALVNFEMVKTSPNWQTAVALAATLLSSSPGPAKERVLASLQEAERQFLGDMAAIYQGVMILLGFRLRPPFTDVKELAVAGAAIIEGLALRHITMPEVVDRRYQIDDEAEWSMAALGFQAIVTQFLEPDPAYDAERAPAAFEEYLAEIGPMD